MSDHPHVTESPPPAARDAGISLRSRMAFAARVLQVRLRFVVVLFAIFLVLALWNYLANSTEWLITRLTGSGARPEHVSPDTEYFCPMCPGVLSNWPEKCPVCKMPLVRRRKGDAALLPEGVLARMQLSPQRLQLAGVQTAPVQYQPLQKSWRSSGQVELDPQHRVTVVAPAAGEIIQLHTQRLWQSAAAGDVLALLRTAAEASPIEIRVPQAGQIVRFLSSPGEQVDAGQVIAEIADIESVMIVCQVSADQLPLIHIGQPVTVALDHSSSVPVGAGRVVGIQPVIEQPAAGAGVRIQLEQQESPIRPGSIVDIVWQVPLAEIEPFRSLPRDPPPIAADAARAVYTCSDHPHYLHTQVDNCPFDQKPLQHRPLAAHQRLEWHCPVHPHVAVAQRSNCDACAGLPCVPTVVSYSPAGQVLAIPDSAVIETGTAQIVFVETGPGMFDAVAVQLGPRSDNLRSVISGLEAGERVVSAGAFLLDAETRLTSNLSAAYFGASGVGLRSSNTSTTIIDSTNVLAGDENLSKFNLPAADLGRIQRQKTCPVTGLMLGSMGTPLRMQVADQLVYLCCSGCKSKVAGGKEFPIPPSDRQTSLAPAVGAGEP